MDDLRNEYVRTLRERTWDMLRVDLAPILNTSFPEIEERMDQVPYPADWLLREIRKQVDTLRFSVTTVPTGMIVEATGAMRVVILDPREI